MKTVLTSLLAFSGSVFAQDISANLATTTLMAATSQGTIDQPWTVSAVSSASEPTRPSQPSIASPPCAPPPPRAPLPTSAPLSPDQPQLPSVPLTALLPHQPTPTSSPMEPQQPTPSAPLPTPVIVNSADVAGTSRTTTQAFATRTFESLQNVSNTLNNLIKVKSF